MNHASVHEGGACDDGIVIEQQFAEQDPEQLWAERRDS